MNSPSSSPWLSNGLRRARCCLVDEVTQRDLAAAVSRMIGGGDKTEKYTVEQMGSVGSVCR